MFQDTGPTGWLRAAAGEEALGEPAIQLGPAAAGQAEQVEEQPVDLSHSLQEIQSRLADLEMKIQEKGSIPESAGE